MTDPRRNLPSASSFGRYAACPGSFALEREMRERGELNIAPNAEADSGTRIHKALAGGEIALTTEEFEVLQACWQLEDELISKSFNFDSVAPVIERERRLWCHDPTNLAPLFSGQFDMLARAEIGGQRSEGSRILLVDYKTGWADVPAATRNWQLRALVALLYAESPEPPSEIIAALITPRVNPRVDIVRYSPEDATMAYHICVEVARSIQRMDHPRIPSEVACRHCPVRDVCPEGRFFVANMSMLTVADRHGELITGAQMGWLLERCELVDRIVPAIRARAQRMLEQDAASVPGWRLKPGAIRQKIIDVGRVWTRAATEGIGPESFTRACSMTKTDLKELVRAEAGFKGKMLDDAVRALIDGCTEEKQNAPTLERVRE